MKGRYALAGAGFVALIIPTAVSLVLQVLSALGHQVLEGTTQEKWQIVNLLVLSYVISGLIWIAYASLRLYRPEL